MAFDFESLLAGPSEKDKQAALTQGLLAAGLGMLSNNRSKNAGMAIGQGGLLGLQAYQGSLGQSRQEAMQRLQMAMMADKVRKEKEREQSIQNLLNPQGMTPGQAASLPGGPTNENAAMIGQPQGPRDIGGLPVDVARLLYATGGPDALAKAIADYAKPTDLQRNVRGLPQADADFATRNALGIAPKPTQINRGGSIDMGMVDPRTGAFTPSSSIQLTESPDALLRERGSIFRHQTPSGSAQLSANVTMRGQNMTDSRSREANDINRNAARTQIVNDPIQGPMLVDKGTGLTTPARFASGAQVPGEVTAKNAANARDVQMLLQQAEQNLTNATGSYSGAGLDQLARVFGVATDGSIAIANLKAIEGALLSKMPRMEGPQSNYDVQAYRQAVGDIGDPTVPNRQKAAAIATVKQIQSKYGAAQGNTGGASGGFGSLQEMIDAELSRRGNR